MILENTEQIINRHFPKNDFEKIDEKGVFRCIKKYQNSPYKVLYIDCKNEWMKTGFDLEKYQEKYLLKDYYRNSGHLQWNNYFVFLSEKENISEFEGQRKKIEEDEIYTRKYIISTEKFEDWLTKSEIITKKINGDIQEDLSSKWINILKEAKLDCIFLKGESYKNGVQNYLDGNPITEEDYKETSKQNSLKEHITKISKLELDNYRPFPEKKSFNFKKVNLIKGVNGAGKTSLIEAIELILCGKNYRNPDEKNTKYKIRALFDGDDDFFRFKPDDTSLYKKRDEYWYNNPYHRGSVKTHLNFRKYNFFNSDAAFELSNKTNGYGVKEAFEDIALGEMVNTIETRMVKFLERFQTENNRFVKYIEDWREDKKNEEDIIKQINEADDDPEKFFQEFLKECKAINWQIDKNLERDQLLIRFEKDYLTANQLIGSIKEAVNWLETISQKTVEELQVKYQEVLEWLNEVNQEIKEIKGNIKNKKSIFSEMQELFNDLNKLESYYEVSNIEKLSGLNKKIENIQSEVNRFSRIGNQIDKVNFKFLENKTGIISEYEVELSKELDKLKKSNNEIENKIEKTRDGLNVLDKIVTEIKAKGSDFIEYNPEAKECPLCHHEYKNNTELAKNINKAHESFKQSGVLESFLQEKNDWEKKIKRLEKESKNISVIKKIGIELYGDDYPEVTISDFFKGVEKNSENLKKSQQTKNEYASIKQQFEDKGLSEEEFEVLIDNLKGKEININRKDDFENYLKKTEYDIKLSKEEIQKSELKVKDIIGEKDRKIDNVVIGSAGNEKVFKTQLKELNKADQNFDDLIEIIGFDKELELFSIKDRVDQLHQLYKKVKDLINNHKQNEIRLKEASEKIQKLDKKINSHKPKQEQASKALTVLEGIFENYSKSEYLKDFFQNNRTEILEIFKLIHSPREFSDLIFDENDTIKLERETGVLATLNEISSGQRSALAISIFLALNKKLKNGPDVLLFDDPVTTIDDLNTLSFLDYLRELAINSNRQIFFATANDDLAYLFKKKFEFLEDESFEEFELERN